MTGSRRFWRSGYFRRLRVLHCTRIRTFHRRKPKNDWRRFGYYSVSSFLGLLSQTSGKADQSEGGLYDTYEPPEFDADNPPSEWSTVSSGYYSTDDPQSARRYYGKQTGTSQPSASDRQVDNLLAASLPQRSVTFSGIDELYAGDGRVIDTRDSWQTFEHIDSRLNSAYREVQTGTQSPADLVSVSGSVLEPMTLTPFNKDFVHSDGSLVPLAHTGLYRAPTLNSLLGVGAVNTAFTTKTIGAFAVYQQNCSAQDVCEIEANKKRAFLDASENAENAIGKSAEISMESHPWRQLTVNDFPFHYKRAYIMKREREVRAFEGAKKRKLGSEQPLDANEDELAESEWQRRKRREKILKKKGLTKKSSLRPAFGDKMGPPTGDGSLLLDDLSELQSMDDSLTRESFIDDLIKRDRDCFGLLVIHLKISRGISMYRFQNILFEALNRHSQMKYRTYVSNALSGIMTQNVLESVQKLVENDELIFVCDDLGHSFDIYYRCGFIPQGVDPHEYVQRPESREFRHLLTVDSDLMTEVFAQIFFNGDPAVTRLSKPQPLEL